jgi:hypothetical protein
MVVFGAGVLRQGAEVFGSALNNQRALDRQRGQPAHTPTLLCAIFKLLGQQSAL